MRNLVILASGSGTNAENLARHFSQSGTARVAAVITDRRDAGVIERMKAFNIPTLYVPGSTWRDRPEEVLATIGRFKPDLVILAGFMRLIPEAVVQRYDGRILNIHPSLLPAHGGKGMYGHHVHEAVIRDGDEKSGVTVHYVDTEYDRGPILMQESFDLNEGETPESLEARIHEVEYSIYPRAVEEALRRLPNDNGAQSEPYPGAAADASWARALHINFNPADHRQSIPAGNNPSQASGPIPPVNDPARQRPMPPNYLVLAVLSTMFCCLIPGIVAIIYSAKVSSLYFSGDFDGAERASKTAQIWIIAAFCLGVVSIPFYMLSSMMMG